MAISLDHDTLADFDDLTDEDAERLAALDTKYVDWEIENAAEAESDFWPVFNHVRKSAINALLGTTY